MAARTRNQSGTGPDRAADGAGASPRAEARADDASAMIEEGLGLYSRGDLVAALAAWRRALTVDPDNQRAREYVAYVEDHFEILDEKFRAARAAEAGAADDPAPAATIELEAEEPMDDLDAYESLELHVEPATPAPAPSPAGWSSRPERDGVALDAVDEGWTLDAAEDLWPSSRDDAETLEMAANPGYLEDLSDLGAAPGIPEAGTGEVTLPEASRRRALREAQAAAARGEFDLSDFDDLGARAGQGEPAGEAAPDEEGGVRVTFRDARADAAAAAEQAEEDDGPDPPTTEHRAIRPGPLDLADDELTTDRSTVRPPTQDHSIEVSSVRIDEHLLRFDDETYERPSLSALDQAVELDTLGGATLLGPAGRPGSEGDTGVHERDPDRETTQLYQRAANAPAPTASVELITAELEAELDEAVGLDASAGDDATRARITWLIERARRDADDARFPTAIIALDLALSERADSAVAQKLIHSNRELLVHIYQSYLGDLGAVAAPAMPMQLIPMQELDHRSAFLLSRVDGVLTLEDILDVSGMARLEAFRHLSRLLLRGILELR